MVTKQIADGYAVMLQDRINHGWDACLLSFMFNSLPGNDRTKVKLMMEEVRATYHKLLTRLYRHPHSKRHDQLPFLIAAPDYQVPKHDRTTHVNPEINNGLHIHAAFACPRHTRLKTNLTTFLTDWRDQLIGQNRYLAELHIKRITHDAPRLTDYLMKSIRRDDLSADDILLLPEARGEYSSRTKYERLQAKTDGAKRRIRRGSC